MTVLAELACARAPSSTDTMKPSPEVKESITNTTTVKEPTIKKNKNPIKELFERKRELYERKQIEKAKTDIISKGTLQKVKKPRKSKKKQEFPLIRNDQYDGMAEKKKRRDIFEKKEDLNSSKTKDVYDFDEEESQIESGFSSVLSYRNKPEYNFKDISSLVSKSTNSLENGNTVNSFSKRLESMIDIKFKDNEKFAPKTKGALKAFQSEDKLVTGPMDDFVERKKGSKRSTEQVKHLKMKKKNKNTKKKSRNAWYENDSSDEFVTAAKTEDVGVGISKSQRTCSKGKQNLFAELSTSSESESLHDIEEMETIDKNELEPITEKDYEDLNKDNEKCEKSLQDDNETYNWEGNTKDNLESIISESDSESESELIIDLKKDSEENKDDKDDDDISEDDEKEDKEVTETKSEKSKKEWIPLEEALNLLEKNDNLDGITKEMKIFAKSSRMKAKRTDSESSNKFNKESKENHSPHEEPEVQDDDLPVLPEKLTTNEKPQKEPENLPLHVFLSRKVQESKKRKQLQRKNKKLQQASMANFEPIRRQRKCAIGKQGLLAEISSSDDEDYSKISQRRSKDKGESERSRKQKKESKEKRKERYIEKKHEQMIAKEQKAIEEEILRELEKNKEEGLKNNSDVEEKDNVQENEDKINKKKHQKQKSYDNEIESDSCDSESKEKKSSKGNQKKKSLKKNKLDKPKSRRNSISSGKDSKERRLSSSKRDSGDEELRTTKSWNKVDEDVGVAIGRRKRAAANQLYYWSSSSDEEEEETIETTTVPEEEDERLEQHGWIVGDSHKKMITMLAMEKQLKEKRRRSEDEFESGKGKSKKHRNSTS